MTQYTELSVKALETALALVGISDTIAEAEERIQKAINNMKADD